MYRGVDVESAERGGGKEQKSLQWCLACDMQNSLLSLDSGSRCISTMSLNYQRWKENCFMEKLKRRE